MTTSTIDQTDSLDYGKINEFTTEVYNEKLVPILREMSQYKRGFSLKVNSSMKGDVLDLGVVLVLEDDFNTLSINEQAQAIILERFLIIALEKISQG